LGEARDFLHVPADLLVANMHYQVLDQITDLEAFYARNYFLLSGLLGQEGHLIEEKIKKRLTLLYAHQENFWFTYLFQKP
jgi:ribosomal protein L11 methyltransferase